MAGLSFYRAIEGVGQEAATQARGLTGAYLQHAETRGIEAREEGRKQAERESRKPYNALLAQIAPLMMNPKLATPELIGNLSAALENAPEDIQKIAFDMLHRIPQEQRAGAAEARAQSEAERSRRLGKVQMESALIGVREREGEIARRPEKERLQTQLIEAQIAAAGRQGQPRPSTLGERGQLLTQLKEFIDFLPGDWTDLQRMEWVRESADRIKQGLGMAEMPEPAALTPEAYIERVRKDITTLSAQEKVARLNQQMEKARGTPYEESLVALLREVSRVQSPARGPGVTLGAEAVPAERPGGTRLDEFDVVFGTDALGRQLIAAAKRLGAITASDALQLLDQEIRQRMQGKGSLDAGYNTYQQMLERIGLAKTRITPGFTRGQIFQMRERGAEGTLGQPNPNVMQFDRNQ